MTDHRDKAEEPSPSLLQALNDPATMRSLLLRYADKVLALEATVADQAPKADAMARVMASNDRLNLTDAEFAILASGTNANFVVLLPEELVALTGYRRPSKQITWLTKNKFKFRLNRVGHPKVDRAHYEDRMGFGKNKPVTEPNWGALNVNPPKQAR